MGSVFLACLSLLLAQDVTNRERIFAAQTLNHRCRMLKLSEALDIESEDGIVNGTQRLVEAWESMRGERLSCLQDDPTMLDEGERRRKQEELKGRSDSILGAWVERYIPMLVHRCSAPNVDVDVGRGIDGAGLLATIMNVLASSLMSFDADEEDDEGREEGIKGTVMMHALAVCLYTSSFSEHIEEGETMSWANAVRSELASAMSIVVLRMRYRPTKSNDLSDNDDDNQASSLTSCPPLIDMLMNVVQCAGECAEFNLLCRTMNVIYVDFVKRPHRHVMSRSILACLTALPETVLLHPGSSRGGEGGKNSVGGRQIPSVDRAAFRAASTELRSVDFGMDRAWVALQRENEAEDDDDVSRVLGCCEAWARYVAVPIRIVDITVRSISSA